MLSIISMWDYTVKCESEVTRKVEPQQLGNIYAPYISATEYCFG